MAAAGGGVQHYHGNMTGSDTDSSSDDEMGSNNIEGVKLKLKSNPSDYDAHLELVKLCKESGELEELRQARNNFSKIFPLTEALWLEWIADEQTLSQTEEEHTALVTGYYTNFSFYIQLPCYSQLQRYSLSWSIIHCPVSAIRPL